MSKQSIYDFSRNMPDRNRCMSFREWSLITGRGGATKREGAAREVLPLRKGGAEKVLAILKGGGAQKVLG